MEQHFSQPRRDKRFSFSIQKNQFHSEGKFMAALIDGITYAKKGWYWKISGEKKSEIGYNSSKESGEART